MKLDEAIGKTVSYKGETFIFSGLNSFGDECYYPDNGKKDYFVRSIKDSEVRDDSPDQKYFKIDGVNYCLTYAQH